MANEIRLLGGDGKGACLAHVRLQAASALSGWACTSLLTARQRPERRARGGAAAALCGTTTAADSLEGLAVEINAEVHAIRRKYGEALEHARRAGEKLLEAKVAGDHGTSRRTVRACLEQPASFSAQARFASRRMVARKAHRRTAGPYRRRLEADVRVTVRGSLGNI